MKPDHAEAKKQLERKIVRMRREMESRHQQELQELKESQVKEIADLRAAGSAAKRRPAHEFKKFELVKSTGCGANGPGGGGFQKGNTCGTSVAGETADDRDKGSGSEWSDEDEAKFERFQSWVDGKKRSINDKMEKALSGSRAKILLTDEQKTAYANAMRDAVDKLPHRVLERVEKNIDEVVVYRDSEMLARILYGKDVNRRVGGAWGRIEGEVNGTLHLDGGYGIQTNQGKPSTEGTELIEHIYLHEIAHAADGVPRGETSFSGTRMLSDSGIWKRAWESEINASDAPLSKYAMTNPSEGFAEFGRHLFTSADAKLDFPKCYAAWEKFGLVGGGDPWESF